MAKAPGLVRDDDYEQMATSYQCVQIVALDSALQEHGITDSAVRQKICESFIFSMGNFHDQGWFKPSPDAKRVYPLLCFTETFLNTDMPLESLGQIYAPSPMFAYHEYAFRTVDIYFQGDQRAQVETGNFEGELIERREPDTTYDKIGALVTSGACVQCGGSGRCYCIRKGPGNPVGCARCNGTGDCGVCQGSGKARR
jgi:hypothetical protein